MNLEPGKTLGAYRLIVKVGAGGMGVVWKALDTRLDREVALKVLSREMASDPGKLKRFEREARSVAALNHPNIVTLYSVEEAEGIRFITMELVEGRTLSDWIPDKGLELGRFFDIAVPLADALSTAHQRGIVHRDLKPGNVMITKEGRVKILDFGLAKLREEGDAPTPPGAASGEALPTKSQLTEAGHIVGTVPYMSPEQLQGLEVDHRSDLFSLGVLLYEMATGSRPFVGKSSAEIISSILRDAPASVTVSKVDFPNHVGRIISHCLEKNVEQRYQSAKDVRNALEHLRHEISVSGLRSPVVSRRKSRPWLIGSVIVGLVGIAALGTIAFLVGKDSVATARSGSVTVLPFANLTGDPSRDYVGEGIRAGLVSQLSEVAGIRVVGGTTWDRDAFGDPRELAKRIGVGAFLEGDVQGRAARIRVGVKLTDADSGLVLWSDTFEADASDVFGLQKDIAYELARVLSVPLSRKELRRLARDPTGSFQAYEFYLRGTRRLERFDDSHDLGSAIEMFRQALRLDPEFALAHAGLSEALWRSYHEDRARNKLDEAGVEAERALAIDPELPAAQIALARVLRSTGRAEESIDELQRALGKHPKPDEAYRELAAGYRRVGDLEETERCLRAAAAAGDENWSNWTALGAFLHETGRYDRAGEAFRRASEVAPSGIGIPHENLAANTVLQGRFDEAIAAYEKIPRPIRNAFVASNIGTAYYFSDRSDRSEKAEEYYKLAVRLDPHSAVIRRNLADLYVDLDRRDEALHHYREALRVVEDQMEADPTDPSLRLQQAIYSAKAEKCTEAIPLAAELSDELPPTASTVHLLAHVYALCGRDEEAIAAVRAAIGLGFSKQIIRQESEFLSLRDDPEFQKLTR